MLVRTYPIGLQEIIAYKTTTCVSRFVRVPTGSASAAQPDETYTYDANGNRTTVTSGSSSSTYTTGADNQLQSDGTYRYAYDAEGNRIAKFIDADADGLLDEGDTNITQYVWDARNRLVEVTDYATYGGSASQVVDYFYDAQNRWIGENIDTDGDGLIDHETRFVYDGNQIVLQFEKAISSPASGSGAAALTVSDLSHRYLWQANAVDQLLADEQLQSTTGSDGYDLSTPGDVLFALTDHLGTVRDLATYDNGVTSIANHRVYDSFGNLTSETNAAVDCLFGYTGRAYDENSGLQNNLNRWYDSKVGRWVSKDPIGFNGLDANTSRYVGNSPTNATDPSGLVEIDGWTIFPRTSEAEGRAFLKSKVGVVEKGAALLSGELIVKINFTKLDVSDPQAKQKYEWLAKLILKGLNANDAPDAVKHLRYWLSGQGNSPKAPKLPLSVLKSAPAYQDLLNLLKTKAEQGGKMKDSFFVPFSANAQGNNVAFLMGNYFYHWQLGAIRGDGTCLATITVDDAYDFHAGLPAEITKERTENLWGIMPIKIIVTVSVPDDVLLEMKKFNGAQNFARKVTWTEIIRTHDRARK